MADNVFGVPITDETLASMHEYFNKPITAKDRAHVALQMINADGKDQQARAHVEYLKAKWGTGVSTLCVVYNATGYTMTHVVDHDWHGHIGPGPYPIKMENGQWGAFLHVKTSGAMSGSEAAVVYRGKNASGVACDWLLAWSNPWNRLEYDNTAYAEIREAGYYTAADHWDFVYSATEKSGYSTTAYWDEAKLTVTTGSDTSPMFEGICTLEGA